LRPRRGESYRARGAAGGTRLSSRSSGCCASAAPTRGVRGCRWPYAQSGTVAAPTASAEFGGDAADGLAVGLARRQRRELVDEDQPGRSRRLADLVPDGFASAFELLGFAAPKGFAARGDDDGCFAPPLIVDADDHG